MPTFSTVQLDLTLADAHQNILRPSCGKMLFLCKQILLLWQGNQSTISGSFAAYGIACTAARMRHVSSGEWIILQDPAVIIEQSKVHGR